METPKEKAKDLIDKMIYHIMYNCQPTLSGMVAKECALIAVDEILNANAIWYKDSIPYNYWNKVKQELNKL